MDYAENYKRLEAHFEEHPEEYRSIARLKDASNAIEAERNKRKAERLKEIEKYRRLYE